MAVVVAPEDIVQRIEQIKAGDFFGENTALLVTFLSFEDAKPYLKDEALQSQWEQKDNEHLRELFTYYKTWWAQKVTDGRGISVHRGRERLVELLFLAGVEGWEVLRDMDGGWYQEDAYNWTADIFGWPHVCGERD